MSKSTHAPASATIARADDTRTDSRVLDYLSEDVRRYVRQAVGTGSLCPREQAVKLYYAVRDGIFYEVYSTDIGRDGLCASAVIRSGRGFCLHKSILYAAAVRAVGIPSRILACRVRNHLSSANLQKLVGGDIFLHWFNEIRLDGVWIKATPVFNSLLCKLYGLTPLEFDGTTDSVRHSYGEGKAMEFLGDFLTFENPTYEDLVEAVRRAHPKMVTPSGIVPGETSLIDETPLASPTSIA